MDLKRANYLPTLEPLDQNRPQSGYMQRAMGPESHGDQGIIDRIMFAAKQGMIHPKVVEYLMENLLQDDAASNAAIGQMPAAPVQPNPMDVVPKGLLSR